MGRARVGVDFFCGLFKVSTRLVFFFYMIRGERKRNSKNDGIVTPYPILKAFKCVKNAKNNATRLTYRVALDLPYLGG